MIGATSPTEDGRPAAPVEKSPLVVLATGRQKARPIHTDGRAFVVLLGDAEQGECSPSESGDEPVRVEEDQEGTSFLSPARGAGRTWPSPRRR
jgi:hypothetical protein